MPHTHTQTYTLPPEHPLQLQSQLQKGGVYDESSVYNLSSHLFAIPIAAAVAANAVA